MLQLPQPLDYIIHNVLLNYTWLIGPSVVALNLMYRKLSKRYTEWTRKVHEHCISLIEDVESVIDEFGRSGVFTPISMHVSKRCEGDSCVEFSDGRNSLYVVISCETNVKVPEHVLIHAKHHGYDLERIVKELESACTSCIEAFTELLKEASEELESIAKGTRARINLSNLLTKVINVNRYSSGKYVEELTVRKRGRHYIIESSDGTKVAEVESEHEAYKLRTKIMSLTLEIAASYKVLDPYITKVAEAREKLIESLNNFRNELMAENYVAGWCKKCPIGKFEKAITDFFRFRFTTLRRIISKVRGVIFD